GKAAPGMWTHCAVRFLADSADGALRALHSVPTRRSSDLALYRLTAQMAPGRLPALTDAQVEALVSGYGKVPAPSANDGMVPTLRSEEHTSELQSRENLVCRPLLEKKKKGQRVNYLKPGCE